MYRACLFCHAALGSNERIEQRWRQTPEETFPMAVPPKKNAQLGGQTEAANFHVFVFSESGELLQQWSAVPSAEQLAAALKQSD